MNKKIRNLILSVASIFLTVVLCVIFVLPYALVWQSFSERNKQKELSLLETATKVSLLPAQKKYTLEAAIPGVILAKDYKSAIEYINKLEKISELGSGIKYLASYSYMQIGDYENALIYAKSSGNKKIQAKIQSKMLEKRI